MSALSEDQKRHLRRLGHGLKPVVLMGSAGLTPTVSEEIRLALEHHELIKVKLVADDRRQRQALAAQIADQSGAALVQQVGNIALLYRPNPDKKRPIALP